MNKKGFTLIELMISLTILLIVSVGFFSWASTVIKTTSNMEKINTANSMLLDIADRLQRLPENDLLKPKTGNENRRVGYDNSGTLKKCSGGSPSQSILNNEFTNPWNNTSKKLYLYDKNACNSTNPYCFSSSVALNDTANTNIDHPNLTTDPSNILPIRSIKNTTYYAVWSVAYLPCSSSSDDKRKIFITVYWIEPEPTETDISVVQSKIASGTYTIKSVSTVADKVIGIE
jgi:prepilin-type N-terminal cleavage/methylation domain-containing protein